MDTERINQLEQQIKDLKVKLEELSLFKDSVLYNNGLANNDLKIDFGRKFIAGPALFTAGVDSPEATSAIMSTGRDRSTVGGVDNSQATLIRRDNLSVFFALGGKVIFGDDARFTSGKNTIVSDKFDQIDTNKLAGQFITVQGDDGSLLNLLISSNNSKTVTVSSNLPITSTSSSFVVYQPVFLGGEEYPWQKLFLHGGDKAGIQFGGGSNGNGANGLLYASGQNLIYRKPNGTLITVA